MKKALRKWINKKRSRQIAAVYVATAIIYALAPIDFLMRCGCGIGYAWEDTGENVAEIREELWTLVDAKSP